MIAVGTAGLASENQSQRPPEPVLRHAGKSVGMMRLDLDQGQRMFLREPGSRRGCLKIGIHVAGDNVRRHVKKQREMIQHGGLGIGVTAGPDMSETL